MRDILRDIELSAGMIALNSDNHEIVRLADMMVGLAQAVMILDQRATKEEEPEDVEHERLEDNEPSPRADASEY